MGRTPWSEAMRTAFKNRFVDPFQDASHHFLHQLVISRRDAEWAFLAIGFWYVGSPYRFETIASVFEPLDDGSDSCFGKPIESGTIHTWRHCPIIGIDVGVCLVPQDRVFHETKETVHWLSLLRDFSKCFQSSHDCSG